MRQDNRKAAKMRRSISKFLDRFPTDATCWSQATDEVRDLAGFAYEYLSDLMELPNVEWLDFGMMRTPSEWNAKGREYILDAFDRMNYTTKERYFEKFSSWFNE